MSYYVTNFCAIKSIVIFKNKLVLYEVEIRYPKRKFVIEVNLFVLYIPNIKWNFTFEANLKALHSKSVANVRLQIYSAILLSKMSGFNRICTAIWFKYIMRFQLKIPLSEAKFSVWSCIVLWCMKRIFRAIWSEIRY